MNLKRVLDHESTFNFWKPKEIGEKVFGKLSSITMNQNGRILQVELADETIQHVSVSTVLENVSWDSYVGKFIQITFGGNIISKTGRNYMTFDVDVEA